MSRRRPLARTSPATRPGRRSSQQRLVIYVEGPRDRDILVAWARRVSSPLARSIRSSATILGGRQPARAERHLRELRRDIEDLRGLCVLDADHHGAHESEDSGLTFHTWGRRHIESYLLVPAAIRRSLRLGESDGRRLERRLQEGLPEPDDEAAMRQVDGKRLLQRGGALGSLLPRPVEPGRIARAMLEEELHEDVLLLFQRIRAGLGLGQSAPPGAPGAGRAGSRPPRGRSTKAPERGIL